jgi:hypothetical protein
MGTAPREITKRVCSDFPEAMFVSAHAASNWSIGLSANCRNCTKRGTTPAASSQGTTPQAQRTTAPKPTQASQTPAQARAGYDPALGSALARRGVSGAPGTVGRCYEFVANAVDAVIGRFLSGGHAYMAASQLAARPSSFTEISASSLSSLPAGAIVVWGKGTSKSGHISIALGDGRESSDFVGSQMTRHYGGAGARVFLPKARMAR